MIKQLHPSLRRLRSYHLGFRIPSLPSGVSYTESNTEDAQTPYIHDDLSNKDINVNMGEGVQNNKAIVTSTLATSTIPTSTIISSTIETSTFETFTSLPLSSPIPTSLPL